jgi:hypothetical protein
MEISYSLTPADALEAQRTHMRSTWGYRFLVGAAGIYALFSVYEVALSTFTEQFPPHCSVHSGFLTLSLFFHGALDEILARVQTP